MTTTIGSFFGNNASANLGAGRARPAALTDVKFGANAIDFKALNAQSSSKNLSSFNALIERLGAIDAALSGGAGAGDTARDISVEDVIGEAQKLSDSLFLNQDQTLFGRAKINHTTFKSGNAVADTLYEFKGVLKQFENLLDAAFKRPRSF